MQLIYFTLPYDIFTFILTFHFKSTYDTIVLKKNTTFIFRFSQKNQFIYEINKNIKHIQPTTILININRHKYKLKVTNDV